MKINENIEVGNTNISLKDLIKHQEVVLFNDDAGSNNDITLNDTVINYKYIEIFYNYGNNYYSSLRIYNANEKVANLVAAMLNHTNGNVYLAACNMKISENKIIPVYYGEYQINTNNLIYTTNRIWVTRVLGYKK